VSKLVLVCLRSPRPGELEATRRRLAAFLESLRPDHWQVAPVAVTDDGNSAVAGVYNLASPDVMHGVSSYAGWLRGDADRWWRPDAPVPDGSFALVRGDARAIEAVADYAASRTLWFAHTEDMFIVSTSQRAIPWFLHSYEPNPRALLWLLGSGAIGHGNSWDRRARPLGPGARARLDRRSWRLTVVEPTILLQADPVPDRMHKERLRHALEAVCGELGLDWSKWLMLLSGGLDSRSILLQMRDRRNVRCVTWGRREARDKPGTDAFVARRISAQLGLSHQYHETDPRPEGIERVLTRFLLAGEGRVDHIAGYLDGFELWRSLAASGVQGVVRGDEASGTGVRSDFTEAARALGFVSWSEIEGVPSLAALGLDHLGPYEAPPDIRYRPDETPTGWVDRVVHASRVPIILGSLSELKSGYVEIAAPLVARPIVEAVRAQPDHLRQSKTLFRALAAEKGLRVPYAVDRAIDDPESALRVEGMREVLLDEISSRTPRELLSNELVSFVLAEFDRAPPADPRPSMMGRLRRTVKPFMPRLVVSTFRERAHAPKLSVRRLALRAYLITRMNARLNDDARTIV